MDYDRQIDVSAFREVGFPIYYEHVALMRTGRVRDSGVYMESRERRRQLIDMRRTRRVRFGTLPPNAAHSVDLINNEVDMVLLGEIPDPDYFGEPLSKTDRLSIIQDKLVSQPKCRNASVTRMMHRRECGFFASNGAPALKIAASQLTPVFFHHRKYDIGTIDKVFVSCWLDDDHVVLGTKCNQLLILHVNTGRLTNIPVLRSSEGGAVATDPCGIHGLAINPSRTLLATGASNTHHIAVYHLPTFDPCCVGENAHNDWVFDLEWFDDTYLISGCRDNTIAMWKLDDANGGRSLCDSLPRYMVLSPHCLRVCEKSFKVRALCINHCRKEMAVLSMNGGIHLWDLESFQQLSSSTLRCHRENVCISANEDYGLYAVGSQSSVMLVDTRQNVYQQVSVWQPLDGRVMQGIRSLSFRTDLLTIGTGNGIIKFFDIRANKFLDTHEGKSSDLILHSGWMRHDHGFRDDIIGATYPNAVYTHTYDMSGARLFAAGGPLAAMLWGNHASLWT